MDNVNLNYFTFDYDLTFAILLMHPDGKIYHRYGSRNHQDALSWISMKSLIRVMKKTLPEHEAYSKKVEKSEPVEVRTARDYPKLKKRLKKDRCIHCHMIHKAEYRKQRNRGHWKPTDIWMYPPPSRIGLTMDVVKQNIVRDVQQNSPAGKAGVQPGDRIRQINSRRILTIADIEWALHHLSGNKTTLTLQIEREEGQTRTKRLKLPRNWKVGTPLEYSWRPFKWGLTPAPGFGGKAISSAKKKQLGLQPNVFAFRVTYIVTWGKNADVGRRVKKAGIRKGDIVYSVAGKQDFENIEHFHAWYRLTRKSGSTIRIKYIRNGKHKSIQLKVQK